MIDAIMAVWNRHHRGNGVKLVLALLLITISISLLLTTFGINVNNSIADHVTSSSHVDDAERVTATTFAKKGEVVSIKTAVTATVVSKKKGVTQPCVVATEQQPEGPINVVIGGKRHKATRTVVAPTATPQPSPTLAVLPTITPTDAPIEPTAIGDNTPTPSPTETITPVVDPTPVYPLPPERTVIVLITPTQAAIATILPTVSPISGDGTVTPTPDLYNEKASLKAHTQQHKEIHRATGEAGAIAQVKHNGNCLSNSVGTPAGGAGVQGIAFNAAIVLGSVLPGALLFYGVLCAVYMLRGRNKKEQHD